MSLLPEQITQWVIDQLEPLDFVLVQNITAAPVQACDITTPVLIVEVLGDPLGELDNAKQPKLGVASRAVFVQLYVPLLAGEMLATALDPQVRKIRAALFGAAKPTGFRSIEEPECQFFTPPQDPTLGRVSLKYDIKYLTEFY